jgi:hypothetical protein
MLPLPFLTTSISVASLSFWTSAPEICSPASGPGGSLMDPSRPWQEVQPPLPSKMTLPAAILAALGSGLVLLVVLLVVLLALFELSSPPQAVKVMASRAQIMSLARVIRGPSFIGVGLQLPVDTGHTSDKCVMVVPLVKSASAGKVLT